MEVSSGILTLDGHVYKKWKNIFQRLKTSNVSGLSFDLTQSQVVGSTWNLDFTSQPFYDGPLHLWLNTYHTWKHVHLFYLKEGIFPYSIWKLLKR